MQTLARSAEQRGIRISECTQDARRELPMDCCVGWFLRPWTRTAESGRANWQPHFESSEADMREKSRDRAPCRPCYTPRATFDVPPYPAERYQAGDRTRSAGKALGGQVGL